MKIDEPYPARRRFLCGMLGGGAAALGAGVGVPLLGYVGNLREEPPPEWLEIAEADWRLAPGQSKKIAYGPVTALLLQTPGPESVLRVFLATCTHLDCPVSYRPAQNRIVCPCHDGSFYVDGSVCSAPPTRPLTQFHHAVRDGTLIIALEKQHLEKAFQKT